MEKKSKKRILIITIFIILVVAFIFCIMIFKANTKVNAPELVEGMTPIKWNGSEWIETTAEDKDWYNYGKKEWANVKLADGSMFVWIPRYAYKITKGYHGEGLEYKVQSSRNDSTKEGGKIEIVFLNGTTNSTFNNKSIDIANTNSRDNYVVHPAFKFGDEELQGIWVAKYEASRADATDTTSGTQSNLAFKNGVLSITDYDLNSAMYFCRNMEKQNIYGWNEQRGTIASTGDIIDDNNNFDTHLMKNTEWGAVCYLAESIYGINGEIAGNTSLVSGKGGISSTTTGNETGIYDMAGQCAEFVSAYYNLGQDNAEIKKYKNAVNFDKKYVDIYNSYGTDNYGDAIYETSKDKFSRRSWYEGQSDFSTSYPFFVRGMSSYSNSIYSFYTTNGDKTSDFSETKTSFRATLVKCTDILTQEENEEKKMQIKQEQMSNVKNTSLNTLLNSLTNNYSKGYLDNMENFTYTFEVSDIDFNKLENYYIAFKKDYEQIKNDISQYEELQKEFKEIISTTDEFLNEFEKACEPTTNTTDITNYFESSSEKWDKAYKLVYKALYGKDLE